MDRHRRNGAEQGVATFADYDHVQKRLDSFHRDARRREERLAQVWSKIERVLGKLLATPLLQNDMQCQALVRRLARAGDPQNFSDRLTDLQIHVVGQAAQKSGAREPASGSTDGVARIVASRGVKTRLGILPDANRPAQESRFEARRRHLQL
ncbi:hypothetical protein OA90_26440 [Labrenzia sp. OB1]|nr:hypothetical protein OA90_26440 [Labrenzia sp. OB1]